MAYVYSETRSLNLMFYMLLNNIAMDKARDALDTQNIFHSSGFSFLCDFTAINDCTVY